MPTSPKRLALALALAAASAAVAAGCAPLDRDPGITRSSRVYRDLGEAPAGDGVRALVALRVRDRGGLDALARELYEPTSPSFRRYLGASDAAARFGPTSEDQSEVRGWLSAHGITVAASTSNGLLLEVRGSVRAFEDAFTTRLHLYEHGDRGFRVYGTPGGVSMPEDLPALAALASLDVAVEQPSPSRAYSPRGRRRDVGLEPAQIARAYGVDELFARGHRGEGAAIGVVTGGAFRPDDVETFLAGFDVARAAPEIVDLLEPAPRSSFEATFDVEWAAAMAPSARVVVFQAPDTRTTSLLFSFTEAVTSGAVDVVTDSYAHFESTEPVRTRELYDLAAELGAVVGVTVLSAAGDSGKPDIPATCPFVTGVGGTTLAIAEDGALDERAWERSGAGRSSFRAPPWQAGFVEGDRRVVADVALNAGSAYASVYQGEWRSTGGTSVASPVLAAIVAVIDGARRSRGAPSVGFLNPVLYGDARVQRAFRDITAGATREHGARDGWDPPTGWGAPRADALLDALP